MNSFMERVQSKTAIKCDMKKVAYNLFKEEYMDSFEVDEVAQADWYINSLCKIT